MTGETTLLILHAPGDPDGGGRWREAFARTSRRAYRWSTVVAPDLPGHGSAPAPPGGSYENGDAILAITPWLEATRAAGERFVVLGAGANGWAAQLIALAGRADGLVLVDGLGGPWGTPVELVHSWRDWARAIADDEAALAPAPTRGLDPRVAHGLPRMGSERLARKAAAEMPVPVVVIESPASSLPPPDRRSLCADFAAGATVHEVDDADPVTVADLLTRRVPVARADVGAAAGAQ